MTIARIHERALAALGAAVLGLAGLLLGPRAAQACSCREVRLVAPADGQTDVPPNTKIWSLHASIDSYADTTYKLHGPDGDVEVTVTWLDTMPYAYGQSFVLSPARDLTPGPHQMESCRAGQCTPFGRFTVGTTRVAPPRVPVERGRTPFFQPGQANSSCGPNATRLQQVKLDWEGVLLLVDIDGGNPYPAQPASWLTTAYTADDVEQAPGPGGEQRAVGIGDGACLNSWPRPNGHPAGSAHLRFGAINIAGEFSGWSAPTLVELPGGESDAAGCELGGARGHRGAAFGGLAAVLPLLLVARVRWRRRRGSAP